MARFDVRPLHGGKPALVLEVQADLLAGLATRVVIPLIPAISAKREAVSALNPILTVGGENFVLMTPAIGPVRSIHLGQPVANVEPEYRDIIVRALDFLFQGF